MRLKEYSKQLEKKLEILLIKKELSHGYQITNLLMKIVTKNIDLFLIIWSKNKLIIC